MRIDVKKFLFLGPWKNRDLFFEKMQKLGIVEFISSYELHPGDQSEEVQTFLEAIRVLRGMVPVEEANEQDPKSSIVLAKQIIEINHRLEKYKEQSRILDKEIARVEIFGDFSVSHLRELEAESKRHIQFFYTKSHKPLSEEAQNDLIFIGSAHEMDYYISINPIRKSYDHLIEMHIEHSVSDLRETLAKVIRDLDEAEIELGRMAHHKELLQQGLINALNFHHLEISKDFVLPLLDGELFAVEGWVPKNKLEKLFQLTNQFNIHTEEIQSEPKDRIPTHLENKGASRVGEDLVRIYDTPSISDRDPSIWVFFAFTLFFSMILADGGYGLILLGIGAYFYYKNKEKKGLGKRVIKLLLTLATACVIWGFLFSSFFGIDIPANSKIRDYSLINWLVVKKADYHLKMKDDVYDEWVKKHPDLKEVTNAEVFVRESVIDKKGETSTPIYTEFVDNIFIELAIFIGTIHLCISFIRYLDKNWAGIGWCIFLIGGYLYFPSILKATSFVNFVFGVPKETATVIGQYLVLAGPALATILAIFQKKLAGSLEIMNVIQVFADVMSYLRIYALGLAGGIMAATFNKMGLGLPWYIGIFIIIAGHIVNLTIGIMGGVIHGLRLNFIEWYHYSFEGGGKEFRPLSLLKWKDN